MLRHVTSTLTAGMLVGVVTAFAQQPSQQQEPSEQQEQQPPKETLTGCVQQAKTTDGGTAYILNNAEGGSATMYVLRSASDADVAPNVSKKVEVTGEVRQPAAPSADAADQNPKVLRPPIVQVDSLKVVADACK